LFGYDAAMVFAPRQSARFASNTLSAQRPRPALAEPYLQPLQFLEFLDG
jgi:hypothetical protein